MSFVSKGLAILAAAGGLALAPAAQASTFAVVHAFTGGSDGRIPIGPLVNVGGVLYGTTQKINGWVGACSTVYSVTQSGMMTVLHTFTDGLDGARPDGPLATVDGTVYGTTHVGGAHHRGIIFSIAPDGMFTPVLAAHKES